MSFLRFLQLAGILLLASVGHVSAYEQIFTASSRQDPFETAGISARAVGLGMAFVGVADDSACVLYNPAGLGGIRKGDLSVHHLSGLSGIRQDLAAIAFPVKDRFGIGVYMHYIDYGRFEGRSETGEVMPDYRASQMGLGASGGVKIAGSLTLGASFRGNQQTLAERSYALFNADVGLLFSTGDGWRLGVSYCNLGANNEAGDSSTAFRVGASRKMEGKEGFALLAAVASTLEPKYGNRLLFGLEGSFKSAYFLRAGYRLNLQETGLSGVQGVTGGAGIAFKGTRLDYAFEPFADIGSIHHLSLVHSFGRVREVPGPASSQAIATPVTVVQTVLQPIAAPPPPPAAAPATTAAESYVTPEPVQPAGGTAPGEMLDLVFTLPSEDIPKGEGLEKQGKTQEAFQVYLSAVQQDKRNAKAWWKLGNLYYRSRMKEQAVRCFEEVLRLTPDNRTLSDWLNQYKAQPVPSPQP